MVRVVPAASTGDVTSTLGSRTNTTRRAVKRMSPSSGEERNDHTCRIPVLQRSLAAVATVGAGAKCLNAPEVTRGDMRVTRRELPLRHSRSRFSNAVGSGIVKTRRSGWLAAGQAVRMEETIQWPGPGRFAMFELDGRSLVCRPG